MNFTILDTKVSRHCAVLAYFVLHFIQLQAQTNIVPSSTSPYYHNPGLTETWTVPLNGGTSGLYGAPATIDFNYGMNNLNNILQTGSHPNASPWIDVRLYVNNRLIWDAQSPNDHNHESGDFHVGSGSILLSGPGIPWSLCHEATCLNHNVRIQLPSNIGPITNVYFTFNAGEDDAQVRINSLTATQLNATPVATNDDRNICGTSTSPINIHVLANDSDGDGDPLTLTIVSGPTNGGSAAVVNNRIRYTPPNPGVNSNSITYRICDPSNACATAVVNISRDFDEISDDCDFDNDGIINRIDIDDDNDGVLDTEENLGCPTTVNKSNVTVSSSLNWNGQLSRAVDGIFNNNLWAALNQNISNQNYLVFDMGSAIALSTIELANHTTGILQQGSRLRVQGSNNNSNWTNLGSVVTIGSPSETGVLTGRTGAANFVFTNTTAYRYYRLRGVSGTTINWYLQEANFEVAPCDEDGDGLANTFDLDSDGDGCPDAAESGAGSEGTLIPGDVVNGNGSSNTTTNVGNAIVQGPYGNNGLASDVETGDGAGAGVTYTVSGDYLDASVQSGCRNCNIADPGLAAAPFCVNGGNDTNDGNDFIRFRIDPTGSELTGGSYTLSVVGGGANFVGGNSGAFGSASTFRLNSGTAGSGVSYTIRITDSNDPNCFLDFTTGVVPSCSAPPRNCDITDEGLIGTPFCVNGGADSDNSNDFIRFRIDPTGTDLAGSSYTLTVSDGAFFTGSSGNSGTFGTAKTFRLSAGTAGSGINYAITITDVDDPACTHTFNTGVVASCSQEPRNCLIVDEGLDGAPYCVNGASDTVSSNDFIRFTIDPTGTDLDGSSYTLSANNGGILTGTSGNTGTFGTAKTFRLHAGSADGSTTYTITITDNSDSGCTRSFDVGPISSCSANRCVASTSGNLDSDGDNVSDICDEDDDNDGILDADECLGHLQTSASLTTEGTVLNPSNSTGYPDGLNARLDASGAIILEMSSILNSGDALSIYMARANAVGRAIIGAGSSAAGPFTDEVVYDDFGTVDVIEEQIYNIASDDVTHIRIRRTNGRVFVDGVQALDGECDTDGDGIINRLDVDSDGDGCFDAVEAGHGESVDAAGRVNGPFGINGLDNDVELADAFGTSTNYTLIESRPDTFDFLFDLINTQCCGSVDSDGDGVFDLCDEDDDNDGIPDIDESNLICLNATSRTVVTPTVANSALAVGSVLPAGSAANNSNSATVRTGAVLVLTLDQELPVGSVVNIHAADVRSDNSAAIDITDEGTGILSIGPSDWTTDDVIHVFELVITAPTDEITMTGGSGAGVFIDGIASCFIDYIDTDGDGIVNRLDLDSDGDGCFDAIEAGHGEAVDVTGRVDGSFGFNGLDDDVELADTFGTSTNYTLTETTPGFIDFLYNRVNRQCCGTIDTDGDGVYDLCDIDDDNDGIPDIDESEVICLNASSTTVSTGTVAYSARAVGSVLSEGSAASNSNSATVRTGAVFILTLDEELPVGSVVNIHAADVRSDNPGAIDIEDEGTGILSIGPSDWSTDDVIHVFQLTITAPTDEITMTGGPGAGVLIDGIESCRIEYLDTDGDRILNHLDRDSDGDGCFDALEAGHNESVDGTGQVDGSFGFNGLDDDLELSDTFTTSINYTLRETNPGSLDFLDSGVNEQCCGDVDTDGDGVFDLCDLDDDNDGIPDSLEGCVLNELTLLNNVDGQFEGLASVATSGGVANGIIEPGAGWIRGTSNPDAHLAPIVGAGVAEGTPSSPQGGVFVGCFGSKQIDPSSGELVVPGGGESFYADINGLVAGRTYEMTFYQANAGYAINPPDPTDPIVGGSQGYWKVEFGPDTLLSPEMVFQGYGNQVWEFVTMHITATSSTQRLEFRANSAPSNASLYAYIAIDDIQIKELECVGIDVDGDGIPNHLDEDSDGDGCFDAIEAGHTETVDNSGRVDGPFGNNGLDNDVEIEDSFVTGINYQLNATNPGMVDFLDSTVSQGCCTVTDEVPDFQDTLAIACFGDSADLTSLMDGNTTPTQAMVVWFITNNSTGTQVGNPAAVGPGSYFAFYLDVTNNCFSTLGDEIVVTEPNSALLASVSMITDASCGGQSDGAIDISVSGGISPYSFSWSNGETTEDINNLVDGTYDVSVTDANNCVVILSNLQVSAPSETTLNMKVFLEGAYDTATQRMQTTLNSLHLLPGQDFSLSGMTPPTPVENTPVGHPYNLAPWHYTGTEGNIYGDPSANPSARSYPVDAVDWMLISIRQGGIDPSNEIWRCASLVQADGNVFVPDDCECLTINSSTEDFFVIAEHRNHLPIMSNALTVSGTELAIDFTSADSWRASIFGNPVGVGQKSLGSIYVMFAGNPVTNPFSEENNINSVDRRIYDNLLNSEFKYLPADLNLDAKIDNSDRSFFDLNFNIFTLIPH